MAKPSNKSDDKMPKKRGRKPKEAVQAESQRAPATDYVSSDEMGANGEINGNVAVPAAIPTPPVVEEEDFTPAPAPPAPVELPPRPRLPNRRIPRPVKNRRMSRSTPSTSGQEGQAAHHRPAEAGRCRAAQDRPQGRHDRIHRPEQAGPDLPDPQGADPPERPDVRRRRAGDPARRLRLPAQPRVQLPACPTTSTSRPPRSGASACGPATSSPARSARPRKAKSISPCCASRRSTTRTPIGCTRRSTSRT